ncbi:unnamed protein product [Ambrosiozyma monospora]|uniref:Unnamed protein product n=1 Tax=Ambrosiozyma monospora TaxID=43982 RepID=A0A9W7DES3_AMBMO|nr:unnamed protein product [Ambrosiozyma monospora]
MAMFRKKKEAPLSKLLDIYNEIANNSLTNLSLEQNNRSNEALSGWKSLHTIAEWRMDQLEKSIQGQELTDEEIYLHDEIRILQAQADDHMKRLESKLSSQHELDNRIYGQHQQQQQQQQQQQKSSSSSLGNSYSTVPTLRTANPTAMNTKKSNKPLLKTLRSFPATSNLSNSNGGGMKGASTMSAAQQAATLIWSPSNSLKQTVDKSYSKSTPAINDLFQDFDQDTTEIDARQQETYKTLQQLQHKGAISQASRNKPDHIEDLIDLSTNMSRLDLSNSTSNNSPQCNYVPLVQQQSYSPKVSQPKPHVKTSAERAQAALKISANVKLRPQQRPTTSRTTGISNGTSRSRSPVKHLKQAASSSALSNAYHHQSQHPHRHQSENSNAKAAHTAANLVSRQKKSTAVVKPHQRQIRVANGTNKQKLKPTAASSNMRKPSPASSSHKQQQDLNSNSLAEGKDTETLSSDSEETDEEKLIASCRGVDPQAARQILKEIVVNGDEVYWDDIAGLDAAKNSLKEAVVYPFLRPDLFSGLREPARGMLLFGPPGTGKTMLARAVATESKSTFFSISASSLTSKYLGESEKLVRALFQLAKKMAPSIIFVDEIDSLLGSRSNDNENESSRRIKNEFLVQWSDLTRAAAGRDQGDDLNRVLVLAATNLPWAIDEAARRRFVRRQYIPLPENQTRKVQFTKLLSHQKHTLNQKDFEELIELTEGFSGSDITALAKDAAMGPLRELGDRLLMTSKNEIRPLCLEDFINSLNYIRPSVSKEGLKEFENWASLYGSSGA